MFLSTRPEAEAERLAALRALDLVDATSDRELDALAQAAAAVCGTPTAFVTLVGADRLWLRASHGACVGVDNSREGAMCTVTIQSDDLLEVRDLSRDARFCNSPHVTGPFAARFYAGKAIHSQGHRVGALCVMDTKPRDLDDMQRRVLGHLAEAASNAIETRRRLKLAIGDATAKADDASLAIIHNARFITTMANSIPAMIAYWDRSLTCRFANAPYLAWTGKPATELIGSSLRQVLGDAYWTLIQARLDAVLRGETQHFEREWPSPDGKALHLLVTYVPDMDASGHVQGFFALLIDVSSMKDATAKLEASEARYRLLAEASSDVVQRLDVTGRRTYVSAASEEVFGVAPDALVGTRPQNFVHREDRERCGTTIDALLSGARDGARIVHRVRHVEGHWLWVEAQYRLIRDAAGRPSEIVASERDISEREALHRSLSDANRRLVLAEEVGHIGHWRLDLATKDIVWSPEIFRIHGLATDQEVPSLDEAIAFYHPDDRSIVADHVARSLANGAPYEFQLRLVRRDGEIRHVLSRGLCERDSLTGEPTAMFGVFMDITELKQSEQRVADKSALLEATLDTMSQALLKVQPDGRIELANRRFWELPGMSVAAARQPAFAHFEELRAHWLATDDAMLADRDADRTAPVSGPPSLTPGRSELIRADGSVLDVQTVAQPDGSLVQTYSDITGRRQAETAQRRSEALYRLLAETTSDSIVRLDLDLRLRYVSPTCRTVLGYEPEEMLGRRCLDFVHPDDASDLRQLIGSLRSEAGDTSRAVATYRMRNAAGAWVWIEASLQYVDATAASGEPCFIGSMRDVTERRRAARHLEQAKAAAEHAAQIQSEFVANVSHELRTPLTGILGIHDLLSQDETLTAGQRRHVLMARDAGNALVGIVNDVLDFAKIEAGEMRVDRVPFRPAEVLEACRALGQQAAASKPLMVVLDVADLPGQLIGDAARLRQVILNLVANAVKFAARGSVIVKVRHGIDGMLRVEVSDTGIGIEAAKLPSLFGRFSQTDSTITRRFGGTGLGLAISKRLVELMGGEIGVCSVVDRGSTFWFEIPSAAVHVETSPAAPATTPRVLADADVLLAEDNEVNREIIASMLAGRGYRVVAVDDGLKAREMLRSDRAFDLVLMDLQMPVMDGLTATRAIRSFEQQNGRSPVPIIGLTANAMVEDVQRCLETGMQAHVAKPIAWGELFGTMERVLPAAEDAIVSAPDTPVVTDSAVHEKLEELSGMIGRERVGRLLDTFVQDLGRMLTDLDDLAPRDLARRAHRLASTAGQFGFAELAGLCIDVELEARDAQGPIHLDRFRSCLQRAIETGACRSLDREYA